MNLSSPGLQRLAERYGILQQLYGFRVLDEVAFDAFVTAPGACALLFAEDPAKVPETWDLTIILPECAKAIPGLPPSRIGLLSPELSRRLAARYGITLWPALLLLRDGGYLGAIEGLKDWAVYQTRIPALLAGETTRAPGIGIPVATVGMVGGQGASGACH